MIARYSVVLICGLTLVAGILSRSIPKTTPIPGREFGLADMSSNDSPASRDEVVSTGPSGPETASIQPKVSIHLRVIEFSVSSPDAYAIVEEFAKRFESATAIPHSSSDQHGNTATVSKRITNLIKEFEDKGVVVILDEPPRIIGAGQTDTWGESVSISATTKVESSDRVLLSLSAAVNGAQIQSTVSLQSGRTLNLGGSTVLTTETQPLFPVLGRIPTIGSD